MGIPSTAKRKSKEISAKILRACLGDYNSRVDSQQEKATYVTASQPLKAWVLTERLTLLTEDSHANAPMYFAL